MPVTVRLRPHGIMLFALLLRDDSIWPICFFGGNTGWHGCLPTVILKWMYVCTSMYVCMYKGCPSWNCPWDRASNWAWGRGPSKVGPMSQPRGTIDTPSRMLIHTNTHVHFLNQLYSRQLRVTCILMYRGAKSHRARMSLDGAVGAVRVLLLLPP